MQPDDRTVSSPTPMTRDELAVTRAKQAQEQPASSAILPWLIAAAIVIAILAYIFL